MPDHALLPPNATGYAPVAPSVTGTTDPPEPDAAAVLGDPPQPAFRLVGRYGVVRDLSSELTLPPEEVAAILAGGDDD